MVSLAYVFRNYFILLQNLLSFADLLQLSFLKSWTHFFQTNAFCCYYLVRWESLLEKLSELECVFDDSFLFFTNLKVKM